MSKRKLIIVLPLSVLVVIATTVWLYISAFPSVVVLYAALLSTVIGFAAKQSIEVVATFNWGFEDYEEHELAEASLDILRDFAFHVPIYVAVFSIIYFGVYWLYVSIF